MPHGTIITIFMNNSYKEYVLPTHELKTFLKALDLLFLVEIFDDPTFLITYTDLLLISLFENIVISKNGLGLQEHQYMDIIIKFDTKNDFLTSFHITYKEDQEYYDEDLIYISEFTDRTIFNTFDTITDLKVFYSIKDKAPMIPSRKAQGTRGRLKPGISSIKPMEINIDFPTIIPITSKPKSVAHYNADLPIIIKHKSVADYKA